MKSEESSQNYLEQILILSLRKDRVRAVDVVNELGFSKPSISAALKKLRENGCVEVAPDGAITLLPPGREIAESIYERHTVLARLLMYLGVSEQTAFADACRVEHYLSAESFEKIKDCSVKLFKDKEEK